MKDCIVVDQSAQSILPDWPTAREQPDYRYCLSLQKSVLQLLDKQERFTPFFIDFDSEALLARRQQMNIHNEMIAKACGLHKQQGLSILDATAGLGRDAFILACLGAEVTLLERNPVVHALLSNALQRAARQDIVEQMTLVHDDAKHYCESQPQFDVVYLDPMFPDKKKKALAKKEMQIFQAFIDDADSDDLLAYALPCARKRVVVKRPNHAEPLSGQQPSIIFKGKSHRFDVYLKKEISGACARVNSNGDSKGESAILPLGRRPHRFPV